MSEVEDSDNVDRQLLIEAPPPPERAEAAPEFAAPSGSGIEAMPVAAPEPQLVLPMVMPAHADASGLLDFVSFVRAEVIYDSASARETSVETGIASAVPPAAPEIPAELTAPPASIAEAPEQDPVASLAQAEVTAEVAPPPPPPPDPGLDAPPPPRIDPPPIPPPLPPPAVTAPAITTATTAASPAITLDPPIRPIPIPAPVPATKPARLSWRRWTQRAALTLIGLAFGYVVLVLVLIGAYRYVDPPRSTVMLGLNLTGQSVDYQPVSLGNISSYLLRAVVTSEDARFCSHAGVDWGALAEAIQDSRGGSTITMQVAKNLFLWPSRSYIRKAIEIPVALTIDFAWPKRRVLEVYLNIAEWGPGVFGAEAAAQYHFNKPASRLNAHEATLLAASLPNPIAREAGDPGRVTALLASRLRARMANSDAYVGCLGLRPMPRAEPPPAPRANTSGPVKAAPKPSPWQTKTEPAAPERPAFNPWQN